MRRSGKLLCLSASLFAFLYGNAAAQSLQKVQPIPVSGFSFQQPEAYVHYLLALRYATDGIPQSALREAAMSLRLQRENNPAAGLAFELIAQQRQNIHIRLCCIQAKILQARFSPDGARIMTILDDKTIRVWDAHTGMQILSSLEHSDNVLAAAWSADSRTIVSSSRDGKVYLWDTGTGKVIREPFQLEKPLTHLAISPDSQTILGSHEGSVVFLKAKSGEVLPFKPAYHDDVNLVTFSQDGKHAMIATNDDAADLVDPVTMRRQHRLPQGNAVFSAVFSRDSRYALVASEDHTARIWNADTGLGEGSAFMQSGALSSAAFSPDATRVLTTSFDHTARIWDAKTGQSLTPPLQHSAPVLNGGFSADGTQVFTRGRDQTIRLWSVSSGEMIAAPIHYTNIFDDAQFSPIEETLLVSIGNIAEVYDTPPGQPAPQWLADLADFEASRSRFDQAKNPDHDLIDHLRTELLNSQQTDRWTQFGKWYFAAPNDRPVSPWSHLSLRMYVEGLISSGTTDSLTYARQIAAGHPTWQLKIEAAQKNSSGELKKYP